MAAAAANTISSSVMSQNIAQILAALKNRKDVESLNTQEHAMSVKEIRKVLCTFIEGSLTDLETVSNQLSRKSVSTPHSELIWGFLQHCIESFPECFVGNVQRQPTNGSAIPGESTRLVVTRECDTSAKAFILWVLARVLRVLAKPDCILLHTKSISAVQSILQLVKSKDLVFYQKILTEFVTLHRVLVVIKDSDVTLPMQLNHFQFFQIEDVLDKDSKSGGEPARVTRQHITIGKGDNSSFQVAISQIILHCVYDVCSFAHQSACDILWETCCKQLQAGDAAIKQLALKTMAELLSARGLPKVPVLDLFIRSLCPLFVALTSEEWKDLPRDAVSSMESSLVICLDTLFCQVPGKARAGSPPVMTAKYVLPPWHMNHIITHLGKVMECGGLDRFYTVELKASVCQVVKYIYTHVPSEYCSLTNVQHQIRDLINTSLIKFIGEDHNQQYMVGCLCHAVQEQVSRRSFLQKKPVSIKAAGEEKAIQSTQATHVKENKSADGKPQEMAIQPPSVMVALSERRLQLITTVRDKEANDIVDLDKLCCELEGVRVAVEVLIRSCLTASSDLVKPSDFFSDEHANQLFELMKATLQSLVQAAEQSIPVSQVILSAMTRTVGKLIDLVMLVFYLSDAVPLPPDLVQFLVFLVSIPWLTKFPAPWSDLPHAFGLSVEDMARVGVVLMNIANVDCMGNCLHQLAVFPREVSPTWRLQIFISVLADPNDQIAVHGIKWLPALLSSLGSLSYSVVPDNLMALISCPPHIQEELGRMVGPLACVLTDHTKVLRRPGPSDDTPQGKNIVLHCPVCDSDKGTKGDKEPLHAVVDAAVFTPFLHLLSPNVTSAVKLAFISSIRRMCTHLAITPDTSAHSCAVRATCCDLIEDPDFKVRLAFSKVISYVVRPASSATTGSPPLSVMSKLKKAFVDASCVSGSRQQGKANTRMQETVVLTIGQLGRTAQGELLLIVMVSLLESLRAQSVYVRAQAFEQIQEIAKFRSKKMSELFSEFKEAICQFVATAVHDIQSSNPTAKESLDIVTEVASVFEFRDIHAFMTSSQRFLIPHLVKMASSASSAVLRLLAKELKVNRRAILIENFKYIFSFLVRTCSPTELEKALSYVQKETDVELGSLLRSEAQSVYNQLLLYLSVSYSKVFSGLSMLASKDVTYTGPRDLSTSQDMANFLQSRLLGILAFYNTVLVTNSDMEDKRLALQSLLKLMGIMGPKHITSVRVKVMGILRLGLRFKEKGFPELACDAWECFIRNIELSSVGPMLSELTVTLLPYIDTHPGRVAQIFHYLIIENKSKLHEYFHEIYFLPDVPELRKVNAVLRAASGMATKRLDLKTLIKRSLKGVAHENLDVRRHALSKLKQLLHDNQVSLHDYVLGNETVDPIIPDIASVLISICRETDPQTRVLVAECLGELGAVDPGRLESLTQVPVDDLPVYASGCDDMDFAGDLINELVRAFLAAHDTRSQDCSAYAIQEVLQVYECTEARKEGAGYKLWRKFPDHVQEVLRPHLYSKYLSSAGPNWSRLPKPIYRSAKGKTFNEWASIWASYMITKVKEEKASRIFQACSKIFKHDIHMALFLLPHVILYCLLDGTTDDIDEIHSEIMAVLIHAQKNEDLPAASSDFGHMSAQTIFTVLDYLNRWTRARAQTFAVRNTMVSSKSTRTHPATEKVPGGKENQHELVQGFLTKIPQNVLAVASFHCKAYTRSLMHFEAFISTQNQDIQEHLGLLQKIYVALDEPDGVAGVEGIRTKKVTLRERILEHESSGELQDASACYENAVQEEPNAISHQKGLLKCLFGLGQVTKALMHAEGVMAQRPEWKSSLNTYRVEAAWRLGQWDSLEGYLKLERGRGDWNVGLGRVLLAARDRDEESFSRQLSIVRSQQIGPLSAASMETGAYQRGYEYIVRLHMLNELEESVKILLKTGSQDDNSDTTPVVRGWKARFQITQKSFRTREAILNLRRIMLNIFPSSDVLKQEQGESWLQSAKVARKAGHVQTAFSSLLSASNYSLPSLCIEQAKCTWSRGDTHKALLCLQKGVSAQWGTSNPGQRKKESAAEKLIHAKALLLEGCWMKETAYYEPNPIIKKFRSVTDLHTDWENGHFYMAKYYDRLMSVCSDGDEKSTKITGMDFIPFVIKHYGTSLQYGNKFIYQSMPRLLTLWLDFGAKVPDQGRGSKSAEKSKTAKNFGEINKNIAQLSETLPAYQFFTAFSLLISRICHPNQKVADQLEVILARLLMTYPNQAVWMMMAVSKSSFPTRSKRCHNIFHKARKQSAAVGKFVDDATRLADRLLEVCNKEFHKNLARDNKLSMSHDFSVLKRLVSDGNFSQIIVPTQAAMTVTLPSGAGAHSDHNPFPDTLPCINGFEDTVEVLSSLQRPKKITIKGSDGNSYIMMCKPKDDLRKDCRTMEFNALINKCLRKDPESRRRQLHVRTYAVIPLNEECGLIEWVQNTHGLRNILNKLYKEKNMLVKGAELKKLLDRAGNAPDAKVRVFTQEFLPRHPPVFHEWFLKSFPNPTSWYQSRLAYCRTTAVMSMVGYILGLGDRHGENILFDSTNGECVHVDLNCLFNKGETFDCPEKVPFRLTQNLTNAMGLLGYEGVFRRSCEVTLRLMRNQCDSLLTVLGTFIHDPLVEWQKSGITADTSKNKETGEATNEEAVKILKDIEQRLKGCYNKKKLMLPLSIEGRVHKLITEATDVHNLAQMYIGWAAYL